MEHSTSAPNERVLRTTQLAKFSFNHPWVVLTADVFQYFYKINKPLESATRGSPSDPNFGGVITAIYSYVIPVANLRLLA